VGVLSARANQLDDNPFFCQGISMSLYKLLSNPIPVYRGMVDITGNIYNAIYLNQCIYWYGKMEGEFYKVEADWEAETTLSAKQQRTCRKHLIDLGFISVDRRGIPAKLHYTTHEDRIMEALSKGTTSPPDMVELDGKVSEDSTCTKGRTITETTQREDIPTNVGIGQSTHSEKKNGKTVAIPYRDILDAWNRICSTKLKGRANKLMPERRTAIAKIWKEDEDMREMGSWENYFEHCAADPFMRGKKNGKHHEGWQADIDYVIRYKTFIKEVEKQPQ